MRLAQIEFERQWKSHFGRDEFLQKDDGFYTCENTATAYFWFEKGLDNYHEGLKESPAESPSTELWQGKAETMAASLWHEYDPENLSDELIDAEGCWHLIDCGEYIGTSRWCNQRHWLDDDTAVVKRFARVWL